MGNPQPAGPDKIRPVRIEAVKSDVPLTVRFLAGYTGLLTHWYGKRSQPCRGERTCPTTQHRTRTIWKGYAPAELWIQSTRFWEPCVIEITELLEERLNGRDLRGECWLLSREVKGDESGPVTGMYCEKFAPETLRQAFDVVPVLKRFYHAADLQVGIPNPIPPRVMLAPVAGEAPQLLRQMLAPRPEELPPSAEQREEMRRKLRAAMANTGRIDSAGKNGAGAGNNGSGQKGGVK